VEKSINSGQIVYQDAGRPRLVTEEDLERVSKMIKERISRAEDISTEAVFSLIEEIAKENCRARNRVYNGIGNTLKYQLLNNKIIKSVRPQATTNARATNEVDIYNGSYFRKTSS